MLSQVFLFFSSLIFSLFLPRLPLATLPRLRVMDGQLAPFPSPQPIDKHLVAQLLLLRTIWNASFLFALIPLVLGFLILQSQPTALVFGLFIGAGWAILSRLIPTVAFAVPNTPYATDLIHQINELRVAEASCCTKPELAWEVAAVRCRNCYSTHLSHARPDLGRVRTDGWLGRLRLLLLDGHPIVTQSNEK
ncbi:MAG: hypothetical protein QF566_01595 [Candidatus Thalassarchaeaceae archaeon]|jgi:hypothetical protein|nr:hypothetical protein [Candidatus Thalassarchaeaceae archaeon]